MKVQRAFNVMRGLVFALLAVLLSLLGYALVFERPFLSYENLPFPPQLREVRAGEVVPLTIRRCNSSSQLRSYTVAHALVSEATGERHILPPQLTAIEPGCETVTSMINRVPAHVQPGRYHIDGSGIVEGSIRSFIVPWHSQPFEVVP